MDTYQECLDLVSDVIRNNDIDLSVVEGDENVILANIQIDDKHITFPSLQEPMLILDEIGTADQFRSFYFSVLMLVNDDYHSGNILMDKLEHYGIPECQNIENLYGNILIKQLFIILHEVGHYCYRNNDELSHFYKTGFTNYLTNLICEGAGYKETIDCTKNSIISLFEQYVDDVEGIKDFFDNYNYKSMSTKYFSDPNNIEESAADLTALLILNNLLRTKINHIEYDPETQSVIEAANYINTVIAWRNLIEGYGTDSSYINNSPIRLSFLLIMSFVTFNDTAPFTYSRENTLRKQLELLVNLKEYECYILKWRDGNNNTYNEMKYNKLKERIDNYAKELKKLYQ